MVKRTKGEMLEAFDGTCSKVEVVPDQMRESGEQIHMEFEPDDKTILEGSKTGKFHEWLRLTSTTTSETVPEGSKIEAYLKEIEIVLPTSKKVDKVFDAFKMMDGKRFHFVRKVLGRSFKGYDAKPSFVPQSVL